MTWTFNFADVGVKARDTVRSLLHDTKTDKRLLQDEEIDWQLTRRGFANGTVDPDTNVPALYLAAAECAEIVAAKFAAESEIAITSVGPVKDNASARFLTLARLLREKGASDVGASFANPADYDITFVAGIDDLPDLE